MITVKHRRADDASWLESDPVIPDGELALVRYDTGYDLKIGDGKSKYSNLSPVMGRSFTDFNEDTSVVLKHRDRASLPNVSSLVIELEGQSRADFLAILSFQTFDFAPEFTVISEEDICYSGSEVEDGVFVPGVFTHYTMIFWRDFTLNCHVRGVYVG